MLSSKRPFFHVLAPALAIGFVFSAAGCRQVRDEAAISTAPVSPSVTTLVLNLGNGQSLYVVVDPASPQTAAILSQMTQAAQAAASQAAAAGAGVTAEQTAAAAAAMNTARSFVTITDNEIRVASLVVDAAGNTATNAGVMAASGMGFCVESSALTLSSLGQVTLSDGTKAASGFVMVGFQATAADGAQVSHVVLGNLDTQIVVDALVPGTGTAGVYSFSLGDTLYSGITPAGVFQPATLPPSLGSVLFDPTLPPATPAQLVSEVSASDLVSVSSGAAKFLANPAVQVGLEVLGVVGDVAYVYQGLQYSEHLYAQTAADVAAALGPFWNYNFPSTKQASPPSSVPYYPGLTEYLLGNGIDPNSMLADPSGKMWFSSPRGQILAVSILSNGTYRISEPSGILVNVDQSGAAVYDMGVTFSVTKTECGDPDAIMGSDGNCVPNPHACDPLASETTCSIGAGSGAENGGYCDDQTDDTCSGGAGVVYGTDIGSSNVGCDPNADPTCPPGGDYCDPMTDPGCSGLQGQSGSGPLPSPSAGVASPTMHQPWAGMRYTDVGIPLPSNPAWPKSDFATYLNHSPGGQFYRWPFDWDYQGEANGKRYFTLYPRSLDVTPLTAFQTNESVGILRGDGSFNFGFAACDYYIGSVTGDYYTVPLTIESFDHNALKISVPSTAPPVCEIVVSQNHNYFDFELSWGWTSNILTGPALATTLAGTDAEIPLSWKTRGVTQTEVHVGSPTGPVVATGGVSGNASVGGVKDGTTFYLVDASTGAMLVSYTAAVLQLLPPATAAGP
jgi:hypothetical protein